MYPDRWSKIPEGINIPVGCEALSALTMDVGIDHFRFPPNDPGLVSSSGVIMSHMEPGQWHASH